MNCQQFELYAAEERVPRGPFFEREEDAQAWLDGLRETPWWPALFGDVKRVDVFFRKGGDGSVGGWHPERAAGQMEMAPPHRCHLFMLHELTHVLAAARYGSRSHDPWFARTYLELVYRVMGSDAYTALHDEFDAAGIEHDTDSPASVGGIAL